MLGSACKSGAWPVMYYKWSVQVQGQVEVHKGFHPCLMDADMRCDSDYLELESLEASTLKPHSECYLPQTVPMSKDRML